MPSRRRLWSISARMALRDRPAPFGPGRIRPWTLVAITTSSRLAMSWSARPTDLLAGAVGVDVGGVEEVDAKPERPLDERSGRLLVEGPGMTATARIAVAHAAQADPRDFEAGLPQPHVLHASSSARSRTRPSEPRLAPGAPGVRDPRPGAEHHVRGSRVRPLAAAEQVAAGSTNVAGRAPRGRSRALPERAVPGIEYDFLIGFSMS